MLLRDGIMSDLCVKNCLHLLVEDLVLIQENNDVFIGVRPRASKGNNNDKSQ